MQLATSVISLVLIIRRFRTAGARVSAHRMSIAQNALNGDN